MTRTIVVLAAAFAGSLATAARSHGDDNAPVPGAAMAQPANPVPQRLDSAIENVLRRVVPSVVQVWFGDGDMLTGTVISADGLVLTCAHLPVPVGEQVQIVLSDGRRSPAKVLSKLPEQGKSNIGKDLALLQITEPGRWPSASVAAAAPTGLDVPLLAVGFPDTMLYGADRAIAPLYVRLGHQIRDPYQLMPEQIVTSIMGTGGDSGGPLFDFEGRVVGVVHGGEPSGSHLNYTRIEVLRQHWQQLASGVSPPPIANIEPARVEPVSAVAEAARQIRGAVVEIHSGARWIGLGCVVGDGLILTKGSELGPNLTVVMAEGNVGIVEVAARDPELDLALLRLSYASELTRGIEPVRWTGTGETRAGTPVVLATPAFLTPQVGVMCFEPRPVPRIAGCVPCEFEDAEGGVRVVRVNDSMRAFRLRPPAFPLRAGDVITSVEGTAVGDLAAFRKLMYDVERIGVQPAAAGETIAVDYRRGDSRMKGAVVLEFCNTPSGQLVRPVSWRYSGFPRAIATDLSVRPEHCGGPVVDRDGRVVGLLIARAPFIESIVLPARDVEKSLKRMTAAAMAKP